MTDNKHPADELHALRQQKSEIERRINEIRTLLMELPPEERLGSSYAAEVIYRERVVPDKDAIATEMGQEWLDAHSVKSSSPWIRTIRLAF